MTEIEERAKIDLGLTGYDELFMNDAERRENKHSLKRLLFVRTAMNGICVFQQTKGSRLVMTEMQKVKAIRKLSFLRKKETPTSQKLLISQFAMTKDDALKYMYAIDPRKRVHRLQDFEVMLYA